jgi:type IV pilus assembly protein PilB
VVFGKKKREVEEDFDDEEEELELILFQGAINGVEANLKANAKLARAGLLPAKELISDALARGAQELLIQPKGARAAVKYVIDGAGFSGPPQPGKRAMAITQVLKLLAGLEVQVRDEPQSGGIHAEYEEVSYLVLVDVTPGPGGERLRIRLENMKKQILKPDDANLTQEFRKKIRSLVTDQSGILLVVGPPGSGATTTSYVLLHTVDSYLYTVFSMADTGHRELNNIATFEPEEGHDLEMSFDRILRREANVVFLDPIEDPEKAQIIFEYQKKVAFLAEFPAPDPATALQTLISWVGADVVADGVRGIVTQKLIRELCHDCKEAYRPNPQLLRKLNLPAETKVLYRAPVPDDEDPEAPTLEELCEPCGGSPYHGRVGMYELLEVTEGMKEVIRAGADPSAVKEQMKADNGQTLQSDGLRLVVDGTTSLEELQRTLRPPKPRGRKRRRRPGR